MLPVPVAEVGRRPDVLRTVALLEDGGHRIGAGTLELGVVRLDPHALVVGRDAHGPRLRNRRLTRSRNRL
jgi:hypothetical protein